MRAYLIDPEAAKVRPVTLSGGADPGAFAGDVDEVRVLLQASTVQEIDAGALPVRLLVAAPAQTDPFRLDLFTLEGRRDPIAGRGLLVGGRRHGPLAQVAVPEAAVMRRIAFPATLFGL